MIHSKNGLEAAAAISGRTAVHSQVFGPYFHPRIEQISGVQAECVTSAVCEFVPSNLKVDFKRDWDEHLRQKGMASCDLEFDQLHTLEENTMRYLNAKRRIPNPARRTVHESRELSIPKKHEHDYLELKRIISSGEDLKPYLSQDIKKKCPDKNDKFLNAWGIQHLHFQKEGTAYILLCKITDTEVFVLQALMHGRQNPEVWVDTQLLQILHDNWPEEIAAGKCHGIPGETVPSSKRLATQNQNANSITTMKDGTVYLAPGGGLMASGECFDDWINRKKIFHELKYWQEIVIGNADRFFTTLNWPPSKDLSI